MLHFLTMGDNRGPLRRYLRWWGRSLHGRVRLIPYEEVDDTARLRPGAYVFCDIERLPPAGLEKAKMIFGDLVARDGRFRLFNDPRRMLRRYDLLRALRQRGLNSFGAYRIDEPRAGIRYPVFVRHVREHSGPLSTLLHDPAGLDAAIGSLIASGIDPADVLIVEFFDTRGSDGYRKYSVMKVGSRVLAMHIFFDESWSVKATTHWPPERVAADNAFMHKNPHGAAVNAVFELAGVEFGRIDYGLRDGGLQVWEINTVPTILLHRSYYGPDRLPGKVAFARDFNAALSELVDGQPTPFFDRLRSYQDIFRRHHRFD